MNEPARPLVVDASAALDFLLQLRSAREIGELLTAPVVRLHAPETIDREVLSALRRQELAGDLTAARAEEVIQDFVAIPLDLHAARPYLYRVWDLRSFLTVGDAYYVALAEALPASLLTTDEKLARGLASVDIDVIVP